MSRFYLHRSIWVRLPLRCRNVITPIPVPGTGDKRVDPLLIPGKCIDVMWPHLIMRELVVVPFSELDIQRSKPSVCLACTNR